MKAGWTIVLVVCGVVAYFAGRKNKEEYTPPPSVQWIGQEDFYRVEVPEGAAWVLLIDTDHGPRSLTGRGAMTLRTQRARCVRLYVEAGRTAYRQPKQGGGVQ